MINISQDDIEAQFLDFLRANNCEPTGNLQLQIDGNIHRYRVQGDKSGETSGAYCLFFDGWPAGWCQNWRNGAAISWHFNRDSLNKSISDNEYNALFAQAKAKKAQTLIEQEKEYAKQAELSRIACQTLPEAPFVSQHPYAVKKKIFSYGLRYQKDGNLLIVPLKNIEGKIVSLQSIDANGVKKFQRGSRTKGAFFSIALDNPELNSPILIGEGMATISTIYQLTSLPCVAAMNCGNIKAVAEAIKKKFPNNPIIIMADNDHKTANNPGKSAADKAVAELKLNGVIMPEFKDNQDGTDWNDFFLLHGEEFTLKLLTDMINYWKLPEPQRKELDKRRSLHSLVKRLDPNTDLPPQIFIGNIFPCGFLSAIVAPPGTGKTMFIQKLVSDLSIGGSVFDGFAENEPVRKCLIFSGEAGFDLMVRRGAQLKWPINPDNVLVVDQHSFESNDTSVMLDDTEGFDNIDRLIKMYKPDIVFFDSLVSFHEKDENKAVDMKPIFKKLEKLAKDKNFALVLVQHSRKRTAKERSLSLVQDDVIGSSVFNRLVALIIAIEPMKDDEQTLLVRQLKNWFRGFTPFTYKITEDLYGNTVMQTDLAPAGVSNARIAVWNYLTDTFKKGEWFSPTQIILSEITPAVSIWQLRRILANFVSTGKLDKRGSTRDTEYAIKDLSS